MGLLWSHPVEIWCMRYATTCAVMLKPGGELELCGELALHGELESHDGLEAHGELAVLTAVRCPV